MTTQVLLYAFLAGFSLILGVILGTTFKFSQRIIAAIMAFGSGVLICALLSGSWKKRLIMEGLMS